MTAASAPTALAPRSPEADDAAAGMWALVERAQAGESAAFATFYDHYFDLVFRYIRFRVGSQPLAEDLASDTFLRALKRINSLTWQGRDPGAWLVTIARNLIADHYKSGRHRLEVTIGEFDDSDVPDLDSSPEQLAIESGTAATLAAAVEMLNPLQRRCIKLRYYEGLSVAETAVAMGRDQGAVKALQYRAIRSLARQLNVQGLQ